MKAPDLPLPASGASYSEATRKGSLQASLPSRRGPLVILDEIHRVPGLFEPLRGIIDQRRREGRRAGHFLLLGSASIDLLRQTGETLAGRVAYCEMQPLNIREAVGLDADDLWHRGGMPDSLLATNDADSFEWRFDFIRTYLERDIPALGPRIPGETLRRFWTMLAHDQGQPFNAAILARSLGLSGRTVGRYLDLMVDLLLVRRLVSWRRNVGKRLVKAPRSYLRDSGICIGSCGPSRSSGAPSRGFRVASIPPPRMSCRTAGSWSMVPTRATRCAMGSRRLAPIPSSGWFLTPRHDGGRRRGGRIRSARNVVDPPPGIARDNGDHFRDKG